MISQEPHARKQRARERRTRVHSGKPELRTMLGAQRKVKLCPSILEWGPSRIAAISGINARSIEEE